MTKWLSVFQLCIYHSLLLYWKVKINNVPDRLVRRIKISEETEARLVLTEHVWSRVMERYFRQVETLCVGVTKVSAIKRILVEWIKSNVPLSEEQ